MPECPECHAMIPAQARFCPHCGKATITMPPTSRPLTQEPQPPLPYTDPELAPPTGEGCALCGRSGAGVILAQVYGRSTCWECKSRLANRRAGAFLIDLVLIQIASALIASAVQALLHMGFSFSSSEAEMGAFWYSGLVTSLLFLFRDGVMDGRSPGKLITGVRVVEKESGWPIGPWRSVKRNLCLIICCFWLPVALQVYGATGERLGDGWARTRVEPVAGPPS